MRGCTAEKLVLTQRSRRAKRPAIVEGCWFRDGIEVVRTGEAAVAPGTPLILRDNLTGPGGPQQDVYKRQMRGYVNTLIYTTAAGPAPPSAGTGPGI